MSKVKFAGVPVELGDNTVILPALSLGQIRALTSTLQEFATVEAADNLEQQERKLQLAATLIAAALSRNYGDAYTADVLSDYVDLNNLAGLLTAIMGQSGFAKVREVAPGE
jgi:hypothetical protein